MMRRGVSTTTMMALLVAVAIMIIDDCEAWGLSKRPVGRLLQRARRAGVGLRATAVDDDAAEVQVLTALSGVIDPDLASDIVSLGCVQNLQVDTLAGFVDLSVRLASPSNPYSELIRDACRKRVEALEWVSDDPSAVEVTLTDDPFFEDAADAVPAGSLSGMRDVANVIAVSSCKGGVGKSTTAVNLAFALNRMGKKVGILDADIYGPSLPTMVKASSDEVEFVGNQIKPLEALGVKLMSFGYVNEATAAMRGPMVMQLLQQFVDLTAWGDLDYLVIDMPPGTGDVQLTLTQVLNITAAVVVTTPQRLSFVDVVKGIDLFDKVSVPSIAVVENMAFYASEPALGVHSDDTAWRNLELDFEAICGLQGRALDAAMSLLPTRAEVQELRGPGGQPPPASSGGGGGGRGERGGGGARARDLPAALQESEANELVQTDAAKRAKLLVAAAQDRAEAGGAKEHRIFGAGHRQRLSDMWGIDATFSVPLDASAARFGDSGVPLVTASPEHPVSLKYIELAQSVDEEVRKLRAGGSPHPSIRFDEATRKLVVDEDVREPRQQIVDPVELRLQCRCALCVEELTGRPLLDPDSVPADIQPMSMSPVGNYALSVTWSDGHQSLYPYSSFLESRRSKPTKEERAAAAVTVTGDPFR